MFSCLSYSLCFYYWLLNLQQGGGWPTCEIKGILPIIFFVIETIMKLNCHCFLLIQKSKHATHVYYEYISTGTIMSVCSYSSSDFLELGFRCKRRLVVRILWPITRFLIFAPICMNSLFNVTRNSRGRYLFLSVYRSKKIS